MPRAFALYKPVGNSSPSDRTLVFKKELYEFLLGKRVFSWKKTPEAVLLEGGTES